MICIEISNDGKIQYFLNGFFPLLQVYSQTFLRDLITTSFYSFQFLIQVHVELICFTHAFEQMHMLLCFLESKVGNFIFYMYVPHSHRKRLFYMHAVVQPVSHGLVHVCGKYGIVLEIVPQEVRHGATEHDRRRFAGLEEVAGDDAFDRPRVFALCDALDQRPLVGAEQCVVVVCHVLLRATQSVADAADDPAVYFLWDRVAQGVQVPMQDLHRGDERQRLSAVHDPVVARGACDNAARLLAFLAASVRVSLLTVLQHVAHRAVENVCAGKRMLLAQHFADVVARHFLARVRAHVTAEEARPQVARQHYERPRVACRGFRAVVVSYVVRHRTTVQRHVFGNSSLYFFRSSKKCVSRMAWQFTIFVFFENSH